MKSTMKLIDCSFISVDMEKVRKATVLLQKNLISFIFEILPTNNGLYKISFFCSNMEYFCYTTIVYDGQNKILTRVFDAFTTHEHNFNQQSSTQETKLTLNEHITEGFQCPNNQNPHDTIVIEEKIKPFTSLTENEILAKMMKASNGQVVCSNSMSQNLNAMQQHQGIQLAKDQDQKKARKYGTALSTDIELYQIFKKYQSGLPVYMAESSIWKFLKEDINQKPVQYLSPIENFIKDRNYLSLYAHLKKLRNYGDNQIEEMIKYFNNHKEYDPSSCRVVYPKGEVIEFSQGCTNQKVIWSFDKNIETNGIKKIR